MFLPNIQIHSIWGLSVYTCLLDFQSVVGDERCELAFDPFGVRDVIGVLKEGDPRPMAVYIPEATMRSTYGYREVKRQSGGITTRHFEISKAWIPVPNAQLAEVMLRAISRGLDPRKERHDLQIKYVPTK